MAHVTAHNSGHTSAPTGWTATLTSLFTDLGARYARYRVFRTSLAEMQVLSDRELADLGLSRSMLRRAAYEAAYG